MAETYGYNPYTWELIGLFHAGPPDFEKAEELIRKGADVNDQGRDKGENALSAIIYYFCDSGVDVNREPCMDCEDGTEKCADCPNNRNPAPGPFLLKIIQFFLDHGFDVNRDGGRYGSQCLAALVFSTFDRYMIDATKLLLRAGARNLDAAPMQWMEDEWSYQNVCEEDHYLGNVYGAAYQVYVALEAGRSYDGIDSFESAVGKRILRVLAETEVGKKPFFSVDEPTSRHDNCFTCNLYFVYDGGFLKITKDASFWVDTVYPETSFVDVSLKFAVLLGAKIESISFGHRSIVKGTTHYGQPITTIHTDRGVSLTFSINFGEVEKKDYVAYYYYRE